MKTIGRRENAITHHENRGAYNGQNIIINYTEEATL